MEKELVKDIKDKIQFLVTIEIFFPALMYGILKATGTNEVISSSNASAWGLGVAFCIANYLFIEEIRGEKTLKVIRSFLYSNLICFIPIIVSIVSVQHNPLSEIYIWPFTIGLHGSLWLPIVTFTLLIIVFVNQFLEKTFRKRAN